MDSLVANYASSDEEEEQQQQDEDPKPSFPLFSSLPPPKSSLFSSLPPPKSQTLAHVSPPNPNSPIEEQKFDKPSLFSSLPPPKSDPSNPNSQIQEQKLDKPSSLFASLPKPTSSSSQLSLLPPPNPKKVVQIKLPAMKPSSFDDNDDDDDIEREGRQTESITQAPSVKSFLSSIPAPKNSTSTLGALPSALGSGRKSILEANVPSPNSSSFVAETQSGVNSNETNYGRSSLISTEYGVSGGGNDASSVNYDSYDGNAVYGSYDNYGNYDYNCNWGGGSAEVAQSSMVGVGESVMKVPGKRGRNEIPQEIVEVTQDELTKNRPREDQVKMTGIAFGPAYQPVSTKGKPTKLHKRKHQIGSLYFDMKQKEMELAERRSKGFLTKAETQAKYGW